MASPATAEGHSNTKTEDELTVFHKKRSRRVSFAETTSVHIFDRDEESDPAADSSEPPTSPSEELPSSTERDSDSRQFFNSEYEDDLDEPGLRIPFIRVVGSPSSGGSTVSATSNDEDNFFGPVSSSFIRRDLLDSAIPDDNHDQTMDSEAFSLHFRSLARSDMEDLKTSTRASFEEKTPTPASIPSDTKNSMQLTVANKPNFEPDVSTFTVGSRSNDMSLVGEYRDMYDYGKLSPAMDPLLAADHDDLHPFFRISVLKSPIIGGKQNGNCPDLVDSSYVQDDKMQGITSHEEYKEDVLVEDNEMGVVDDRASKSPPSSQFNEGVLAVKTNEPVKKAFGTNSSMEFLATSQGTPSNHTNSVQQLNNVNSVHQLNNVAEKENETPLVGSTRHLTSKPGHMLLNGAGLFKSPGTVTPSYNPASVIQRVGSLSLQKSMSKLGILEASPISAVLSAKLQDSASRSLSRLSKMTPVNLLENERLSTNVDGNSTVTPKNLVPKVLPSENTRPREHTHQTILRSPNIRSGYKGDENKNGSSQTANSFIKLNTATAAISGVSSNRDEDQSIQHNGPLEFGPGHVEGSVTASDGMGSLNIKGKENSTPVNATTLLAANNDDLHAVSNISVLNSCHKNLADQFGGSPSIKELVLHSKNNESFGAENVPSERKRKAEDVTTDKIAKIKKSSSSDLELRSDCGMSCIGPSLDHLVETYTLFFNETKLLSPSVDKMNLHAIDRLDDILGQLEKAKTYQLLSDGIRSKNKRAAEIKLKLCEYAYAQAKLQLMHAKRERLLKNAHSLASRIQETNILKLNTKQNKLDIQVTTHQQSLQVIEESQIDKDKLTSMTQTVKDIDRRISDLTKSFHVSCNMKGEPNATDTIAYANAHLKKRAQYQNIRKDMQVWVIDNMKSSKDHHEVVLNYLGLMSQRLTTVTAGVVPKISISNALNQMNINKNFKDMEASTAFRFVFDSGVVQKHATATSLQQETQMTSSLLGNLVDVLEEIKLARIELIKNMMYARFHTSADEHLDLELYFFDSSSRKKATITLDTTCLRRGIYPSEIVASQIDISLDETGKLSAEITAAVRDLGVGFYRILRLCRCISQLVSLQGKR